MSGVALRIHPDSGHERLRLGHDMPKTGHVTLFSRQILMAASPIGSARSDRKLPPE